MNKEDYVSLEVAKKLQEKGFREPCYATYMMEFKDEFTLYIGTWKKTKFEHLSRIPSEGIQLQYLAPSLYEAQKWLREKNNIHLDVRCTAYCKPLNRCDYVCEIFSLPCHIFGDTKVFHKYEEALNAGILESINYI